MSFRRIGSGLLAYQSEWLAVREYQVERDGVRALYPVLERPDAVVVILLTPTERTVLLRQFRFPTQDNSWELPMGGVAGTESVEAAARREVMEELGVGADRMIPIGEFRPAPGLTPQRATVFVLPLADEALDRVMSSWSSSEEIQEVSAVSVSELAVMIAERRVTDGFSLAAFLLLQLWMTHGHAPDR